VDGIARLISPPRHGMIRPDRWQLTARDARRFLRDWAVQATGLGWKTLDLFGAHPTRRVQRLDCAGLVVLLHGDQLVAITADTARIRTRTGAALTYYRRPRPEAVPLWQLAAPLEAAGAQPDEALNQIMREVKRLFRGATVTVRETTSTPRPATRSDPSLKESAL
jgi:hypothetical protein